MSWMQKLYETYNYCQSSIGYPEKEGQRPLLPICHITAQAQIEIVINGEGQFLRASIVNDKNDSTTIIPCTEGSASRAGSKPENHPLCDKLQYVAGDFLDHGGTVTSGFASDSAAPFRNYVKSLTDWCNSPYAHDKAKAALSYVSKKSVIKDLVNCGLLQVGEHGKFLLKNEVEREKNTVDIFSVVDLQDNAFVRWVVETPGVDETKVWKDNTLWDSWIDYYLSSKEKEDLCYVTGEKAILTANHPKYIRREGDGAKLISSNDSSGFTFRGRFLTGEQACNVSLEVSQKAHYALLWLISRQGYKKGDLAIVAWATNGESVPQPTASFDELSVDALHLESDEKSPADTAQIEAVQLRKRIAGYGKKIDHTTDIVVMAVNSATPGRLSITYYRQLTGSDFLQRLDHWHESCAWQHDYKIVEKKRIPFVGAPTPYDIAEAAYGNHVDDKLAKVTIGRILPCIIDGLPIPRDLVESAVRRASNRIGIKDRDDKKYYGDEEYTWKKTLSIACALFKKYNRKEKYTMSLDPDRKTRDYLYGRLLALADNLEEWALNEANEKRQTNAARLMQRFAERPYSTWRTIELALTPYKARLGKKASSRQRLVDQVIASFNEGDFLSDKRLSGEFLLGYHCQREELRHRANGNDGNNELVGQNS